MGIIKASPRRRPPLSRACLLPTGDVAVLERSYSPAAGVTVRLSRVPAAQIKPGARLVPRELALWREPLCVDNLEGLAARQDASGRTLIYMLSDDNYNPMQRTLLMLWELPQAAPR